MAHSSAEGRSTETDEPTGPFDRSGLGSVGRLPMHALAARPDLVLDGTWEFQLRSSDRAPETADWQEVIVPELWTMRTPEDPPHYTNVFMPFDEIPPIVPARNPMGVYRRVFTWTPTADERTVLHVGAAEGVLHVRVNGYPVGTSGDSHLHAEFDITDVLGAGENTLELAVSKFSSATYIEDQDQWWQSGLSRSIHLERRRHVRIADVHVQADWDVASSTGTLALAVHTGGLAHRFDVDHRVRVGLLGAVHKTPVPPRLPVQTLPPPSRDRSTRPERRFPDDFSDRLSITAADAPIPDALLTGDDGNARVESAAPRAGVAEFTMDGLEVAPWTAEQPHLVPVHIELLAADGSVVDERRLDIGFRTVAIEGRDLLVNGRRVLIQGVNRHDVDPRTGRVITRERMDRELALLKRHNVNAIRTSHYPNDPYFLDRCDRLGFYVVAEADVEAHAFMATVPDEPTYLPEIVDRVARMVARDRNHPSVIIWSLGNESGYGGAHDAAAAWVRRTDPSRPVQYEGAVSQNWYGGHAASDIACPMYASFASLEAYSADPRGDRPLILSEYAYSQGNSTGGFDHYWHLFETLPGLQGGFIWEFTDHSLDPDGDGRYRFGGDFGDQPNSGQVLLNGLCFPDLTPKPALLEVRHVFSPVRITSDGETTRSGKLRIANRQTFADLARYAFEIEVAGADGPRLRGDLDLSDLQAGEERSVDLPAGFVEAMNEQGVLGLTLRTRLGRDEQWGSAGETVDLAQVRIDGPRVAPSTRASRRSLHGATIAHPLLLAPPELALWRALTDNEISYALDQRFVRTGLFSLDPVDVRVTAAGDRTVVTREYVGAFGDPVTHRRGITVLGTDDYLLDEHVELSEGVRDLLRVGMRFELSTEFDSVEWTGLGPWENYPDRRSSAVLGRWRSRIDALATPYLRPQENGTRGGVTRLQVISPTDTVSVASERPLHFNVSRWTIEQLEQVEHWWELPDSERTVVHVDAAHRGVGTGRIGPDTQARFRLREPRYEWSWRLTLPPIT